MLYLSPYKPLDAHPHVVQLTQTLKALALVHPRNEMTKRIARRILPNETICAEGVIPLRT
jgi:hypothetical protein